MSEFLTASNALIGIFICLWICGVMWVRENNKQVRSNDQKVEDLQDRVEILERFLAETKVTDLELDTEQGYNGQGLSAGDS